MDLQAIDINQNPKICRLARELYLQAFPKEERLPWWLLRLNARRQGIDLTAYMQGDTFCGFTASATVDGMHFLLFFAISEHLRGQGYGSAVLQKLRADHSCVVLNVELLRPDAPNLQERENRIAFYRKNGFYDTGYHIWEVGGEFLVLCTDPQPDIPRYKKIFRKLSLGFWDVRIEKAGS